MPPLNTLKKILKNLTPRPIYAAWRKFRLEQVRRTESRLSLEEVFTSIYTTNRWGGQPGEFNSGSGSADAVTRRYVNEVGQFIREKGIATVLDVGCGDFRVGSKIAREGLIYTGIDIVRPLIERNRREFGSASVRFEHVNVVDDALPPADLCLVREVLQHLSNAQIAKILPKLAAYRHVLVTEARPPVIAVPNQDKTAGSAVRNFTGSCVLLDQPPFSVPNVTLMFTTPAAAGDNTICTYLIDNGVVAELAAAK